MADIFEQVDDALREDRMQGMWKRFGWMIIALAILIVAGTASVVGWRAYEKSSAEDQTRELNEVIAASADAEPDVAIAALTEFADGAESGVAAVARMRAAARAIEDGDRDQAIALYAAIADSADTDPVLRDAATVLGSAIEADTADLDALRAKLAGLDAANSPWRFMVAEIIAAAAIRDGDLDTAKARLTGIVDDAEAPTALRRRAAEILAAIGGSVTPEVDEVPIDDNSIDEGTDTGEDAEPSADEGAN